MDNIFSTYHQPIIVEINNLILVIKIISFLIHLNLKITLSSKKYSIVISKNLLHLYHPGKSIVPLSLKRKLFKIHQINNLIM